MDYRGFCDQHSLTRATRLMNIMTFTFPTLPNTFSCCRLSLIEPCTISRVVAIPRNEKVVLACGVLAQVLKTQPLFPLVHAIHSKEHSTQMKTRPACLCEVQKVWHRRYNAESLRGNVLLPTSLRHDARTGDTLELHSTQQLRQQYQPYAISQN